MFYKNKAVERVLQNDQASRSNDRLLIMKVWEMYGFGFSDRQRSLFLSGRLPSPETIRRTRQKLQQDGKYTANLTVLNQRKTLADQTKSEFGQQAQIKMFDQRLGRKMRDIIL